MRERSVLIFGCGMLQRSLIAKARAMGLKTVGIDPCADAAARKDVDVFEIVDGRDYEATLDAARRHAVAGLVTAATDKPLEMMARVASALSLPFFSVETAHRSTDKWLMKQRFLSGGVPCARGSLLSCAEDARKLRFPLILKPRDNSGSRGVRICCSMEEVEEAFTAAMGFSRLDKVLAEEVIEGQEYSMEGLHYGGRSEVIQFTEKQTTPFPYNVELAHRQPARLSAERQDALRGILARIGECMGFENCASHTEFKINGKGICVIESSPRTGGDYIVSDLTPLSTGVDMETQLLHLALGETPDLSSGRVEKAAGVGFFHFPAGRVLCRTSAFDALAQAEGVVHWDCRLPDGAAVPPLTSSLDRYGEYILSADTRDALDARMDALEQQISQKTNTY